MRRQLGVSGARAGRPFCTSFLCIAPLPIGTLSHSFMRAGFGSGRAYVMKRDFTGSGASLAALLLAPAAEARSRYEAQITRTTYEHPPISRPIAGRAWATGSPMPMPRNNLCLLAEEFATVAGDRSRHFGPKATAVLGLPGGRQSSPPTCSSGR